MHARRRLRPLAMVGFAAGITAVALWAAPRSSGAPQVQAFAKGALSLKNSRNGSPIFSASNLAPGDSVAGAVTITDTGRLAGSLVLASSNLADTPGPNGGRLGRLLDLHIDDVTGGADRPVYAGKLASMPTQNLGCLLRGGKRTYRFTATFPDGGPPSSSTTGDNAYQGSAVSVNYLWTLSSANCARAGRRRTHSGRRHRRA
jgi:spore coat-associated protein N